MKYRLNDEEREEVEDAINPLSFENYCGACDLFNTQECPFLFLVSEHTRWKDKKCNNFID